jgi:hypothetical protein
VQNGRFVYVRLSILRHLHAGIQKSFSLCFDSTLITIECQDARARCKITATTLASGKLSRHFVASSGDDLRVVRCVGLMFLSPMQLPVQAAATETYFVRQLGRSLRRPRASFTKIRPDPKSTQPAHHTTKNHPNLITNSHSRRPSAQHRAVRLHIWRSCIVYSWRPEETAISVRRVSW